MKGSKMVRYQVRAISLLNLVNDVKMRRLIPDAYFQRELVWRELHKKDFIKTILLGLPFPQMFISRGKIDVETMQSVACIVDGQQRTNAILDFISDAFDVDGRRFSDLQEKEKSDFLKYEIAVIEIDLDNDDPVIKDIFLRINRASNSLTAIEKMSTQYSTSELMLVAKLLVDDLVFPDQESDDADIRIDPNVPNYFYGWAARKKLRAFKKLVHTKHVFDSREIAKKVHLSYALNILVTHISGFYKRNEKVAEYLNDYAQDFPDKNEVVDQLERAANIYLSLGLKSKGYWFNKANFFSLMVALAKVVEDGAKIDYEGLSMALTEFESDAPDDYKAVAAQAVNDLQSRQLRHQYIWEMISRNCLG